MSRQENWFQYDFAEVERKIRDQLSPEDRKKRKTDTFAQMYGTTRIGTMYYEFIGEAPSSWEEDESVINLESGEYRIN